MNEIQHNVDRLAEIIANYVGVNELPYSLLEDLEQLWPSLKASESLQNFWSERFNRAKKMTTQFV